MPEYEYQCMECGDVFSVNLKTEDLDKNPKISCPHCGAEHVHRKVPVSSDES